MKVAEVTEWRKAISRERDLMQSRILVFVVVATLIWGEAVGWRLITLEGVGISALFAAIVVGLRAATGAGAGLGGLICLVILTAWPHVFVPLSGLSPLLGLFVLTWAATRLGRRRKEKLGVAEGRRGRRASQVAANLGFAGMVAAGSFVGRGVEVVFLAALVEATGDTVSSEIGQVVDSKVFLLTSSRRVEAGTDGGVSLWGTATGVLAGAAVAAIGMWSLQLTQKEGLAAFAGGVAGVFFDSFLGATVERRGILGNDLVNFLSTVFAGLLGFLLFLVEK